MSFCSEIRFAISSEVMDTIGKQQGIVGWRRRCKLRFSLFQVTKDVRQLIEFRAYNFGHQIILAVEYRLLTMSRGVSNSAALLRR
jgi:hypothetical protein